MRYGSRRCVIAVDACTSLCHSVQHYFEISPFPGSTVYRIPLTVELGFLCGCALVGALGMCARCLIDIFRRRTLSSNISTERICDRLLPYPDTTYRNPQNRELTLTLSMMASRSSIGRHLLTCTLILLQRRRHVLSTVISPVYPTASPPSLCSHSSASPSSRRIDGPTRCTSASSPRSATSRRYSPSTSSRAYS